MVYYDWINEITSKLLRWDMKLQNYSFTIEYKKREDNVVADCLSRMYLVTEEDLKEYMTWVKEDKHLGPIYAGLASALKEMEDKCADAELNVSNPDVKRVIDNIMWTLMQDGRLWRKDRLHSNRIG